MPALLLAAQVFVFGTWAVYLGNRQEMVHTFASLVRLGLPAMAALTIGLVAVATVLGRRAASVWIAIVFTLGVLMWVQGNFLLVDYGQLDGTDLDWSRHDRRGLFELALWLAATIGAAFASRRVAASASFASALLLALQGSVLLIGLGQSDTNPPQEARDADLPPEAFTFSGGQNVLFLVLDALQSDVVAELIDADPGHFDRALSGFTFFRDHLGAFPTTKFSVPAMLASEVYRNRVSSWDHIARSMDERSVLGTLVERGFEVDLMSISRPFVRGPVTRSWVVPRPYVPIEDRRGFAAAQLLDLSLFRQLPHAVKPWLYNEQNWRFQARSDVRARSHQAVNSHAFLTDFARRMTVSGTAPRVKYLHVGGAHLPIVQDAECRFLGGVIDADRASYRAQATCTLRSLETVLERLRALGLYDDSLIVVTSDHGIHLAPEPFTGEPIFADLPRIAGTAGALLLVKPPHATGSLQTSDAPSQITDVPATLLSLLGQAHDYPGRSVFALDAATPRPRTFGYYRWFRGDWRRDHLHAIHLLTVDGPSDEAASWRYETSLLDPGFAPRTGVLELAREDRDDQLGPGWHTQPARDVTGTAGETLAGRWSHGREAVLFAAMPEGGDVEIELGLAGAPCTRTVTLSIDGSPAGRLAVGAEHSSHVVPITAGPRPPWSVVHLAAETEGRCPDSRHFFLDRLAVRSR